MLAARLSAAEAEGAALRQRIATAEAAAGEACYLAAAEVASDAAAAAAAEAEEDATKSSIKKSKKKSGKGRQQQNECDEGAAAAGATATAAAAPPPPALPSFSAGGPFIVLGRLELGSTLRVASARGSPPPAGAAIQWMRKKESRRKREGRESGGGAKSSNGGEAGTQLQLLDGGDAGGEEGWRPIPGATRPSYAPEPDDVGARLACRLGGNGGGSGRRSGSAADGASFSPCSPSPSPSPAKVALVAAAGTVAPSPGGARHVLALLSSGGGAFPVAVVPAGPCGGSRDSSAPPLLLSLVLDADGAGLRSLSPEQGRGESGSGSPSSSSSPPSSSAWVVRAPWHSGMALCGARGGGGGAAQALFFSFGEGGSGSESGGQSSTTTSRFILALQSPRARNAALSLARALAERARVRLGSVDGLGTGGKTRAEDSGARPAALRF